MKNILLACAIAVTATFATSAPSEAAGYKKHHQQEEMHARRDRHKSHCTIKRVRDKHTGHLTFKKIKVCN